MSVDIPNPIGLDIVGDVPITIAGGATPLGIDITNLPKIFIGIDKLNIGLDKLNIGLDKINVGLDKINIGIDPLTLNVNVAITELPSLRVHLPTSFKVGFRMFNFDLACIELCGEAQVITEPFVPHPAERCPERTASVSTGSVSATRGGLSPPVLTVK